MSKRFKGPPKERVRSPLKRRLSENSLKQASLAGLLRLAESLNIETKFRSDDTEKSFHRRIIFAILRWEKLYSRGRCT